MGSSDRSHIAGRPLNADVFRIASNEFVIGDVDAPVTMVVYFNFSCAFCAEFFDDVVPRLKTDFVDRGKVRLVARIFPASPDITGYPILAAEVAACAGTQGRFWEMSQVLFEHQGGDVWKHYRQWTQVAGMDSTALDGCMEFHKMRQYVLNAQGRFAWHNIRSTPTVIINDRKVEGLYRFEVYAGLIRKVLD